MKKIPTNTILIIAILLITLAVVYMYWQQIKDAIAPKDATENTQSTTTVPKKTTPTKQTQSTNSNKYDALPLVLELHDVMAGVFTSVATKDQAYSKLLLLNNVQLVAVYNLFNQLYYSDSGQNLLQWIQHEGYDANTGIAQKAIAKLQTLQFKK